jgi:DNA-binding LacI/PurR family transcriptional regulator
MQPQTKHREIGRQLEQAIRSGEFSPAARLPGEKELARRYDVSFMTARRTVTSLVESGILERRGNSGTYVRDEAIERLSSTILHVLVPAYDSPTCMEIIDHAQTAIDARPGWRLEVTRAHPHRQTQMESILLSGEPCLWLSNYEDLTGRLGALLERPQCRVVNIGNVPPGMRVPSVFTEGPSAITQAIDYLEERGHRHIGIISDRPTCACPAEQVALWQARICDRYDQDVSKLRIDAATPAFKYPPDYVYPAMMEWLREAGRYATAVIALSPEPALAVLAAAEDSGRKVGEDLSLISCSSSRLLHYLRPEVTCVDQRLAEHVRRGLEILDRLCDGTLQESDRMTVVPMHIVEGHSVARLR